MTTTSIFYGLSPENKLQILCNKLVTSVTHIHYTKYMFSDMIQNIPVHSWLSFKILNNRTKPRQITKLHQSYIFHHVEYLDGNKNYKISLYVFSQTL